MLQDRPSFWDKTYLPFLYAKDALGTPSYAWEYPGKLGNTLGNSGIPRALSSWCRSLSLSLPLAGMLRDMLGISKDAPGLDSSTSRGCSGIITPRQPPR